jgi:CDGSH-type Zn-finger protein
LKCVGRVAVSSADGRIRESQDIRLCRCGGSATKPFCDGTHRRNGFVS